MHLFVREPRKDNASQSTMICDAYCYVCMLRNDAQQTIPDTFACFSWFCLCLHDGKHVWETLNYADRKTMPEREKKKRQRHNASQIHHICWQVEESWLRFDSTDVNMLICLALLDSKHTLLCSDRLNSSVKHKDCLSVCIAVLFLKEYIHVCVHFLDNYLCILCDTCKHNILIM